MNEKKEKREEKCACIQPNKIIIYIFFKVENLRRLLRHLLHLFLFCFVLAALAYTHCTHSPVLHVHTCVSRGGAFGWSCYFPLALTISSLPALPSIFFFPSKFVRTCRCMCVWCVCVCVCGRVCVCVCVGVLITAAR